MQVFAIPADSSEMPFLMFIADMGEDRAHQNAHRTRHLYTQKIAAYEFRPKCGAARRFDFAD